MKFGRRFCGLLLLLSAIWLAADDVPKSANSKSAAAKPGDSSLEAVLTTMDAAAARFHSAQADLASEQFQKVVNETDTQKGKVYFRRKSGDLEMAIDMTSPDPKYVLVKDGKARLYQPNIDQVTEYSMGKNRQDAEGMFALGFGGRGHDLLKSFNVKMAGAETMDGTKATKLELSPKSDKVKSMFSLITLWVDAGRGTSLKQRFDEPSGDYRLATYTNIKLNQKVNDEVFKLKTTPNTKVVKPQG